jgi:hypothetical protein
MKELPSNYLARIVVTPVLLVEMHGRKRVYTEPEHGG